MTSALEQIDETTVKLTINVTEEDLAPIMQPGPDRLFWLMGFPNDRTPVWTDDHANVIAQFKGLQGFR